MPDSEEIKLSGEFVLKKPKENLPEGKISQEKASLGTTKAYFYSSLCLYPKNVKFENQETDEEVILLVRRALITNVPWIITTLILILIPLVIFIASELFSPFFKISASTQLVMLLFYYLAIIGFILVEFTIWYFNVGLVTNRRIIDLDVSGILFKHSAETRLELIEDVSYSQVGSVRSILNYGDVHMQTAGTISNFEFDRTPEPARVVRIIGSMIGGKGP